MSIWQTSGWICWVALLTTAIQTKAEAPKGLAASRFANSGDDEDSASGTADKPGETETDNSSAALASVRAIPIF